MNELDEVITSAEFNPQESHSFVYATSKGQVKLADMRQRALCDSSSRCTFFIFILHHL